MEKKWYRTLILYYNYNLIAIITFEKNNFEQYLVDNKLVNTD